MPLDRFCVVMPRGSCRCRSRIPALFLQVNRAIMQTEEVKSRFGRCPYCRAMIYQDLSAIIFYCSKCRTPIRGTRALGRVPAHDAVSCRLLCSAPGAIDRLMGSILLPHCCRQEPATHRRDRVRARAARDPLRRHRLRVLRRRRTAKPEVGLGRRG